MNKKLIQIKQKSDHSLCQQCTTRWCCSNKHFGPAPISQKEINNLIKQGYSDFYDLKDDCNILKYKSNGYCCFYDQQKKTCLCYEHKPFDCNLFPYDFFTDTNNKEGIWILWNCPYSKSLSKTTIEKDLSYFEQNFKHDLHKIWHHDNESISNCNDKNLFVFLRKMKVDSPFDFFI